MSVLAIALCRVSTPEQIENNSLNRQKEAVERCAKEKDLEIVRWWSGSVSSKTGTNLKRKDLNEMLAVCAKNKRIKYLIVDEYDRFMRSGDEGPYFEVRFKSLGVKVWFASEDDTFNSDTALGKFLRSSSAFRAEGSNEERIHKSIAGGQKSIQEGRLPSHPKTGYKKGLERGVHVPDWTIARPYQKALKMIASHNKTPSEALKWLKTTEFGKRHPRYKMDKFRKHACDVYNYGAVELKGKLNVRNENGLHEPLITKAEHEAILRAFDKNAKKQQGYRPDKDTRYPMTNKITCLTCDIAERHNPRFSSAPISNGSKNHGKPRKKVSHYEKYRCRTCNRYIERTDVHDSFSELLDNIILPDPELKKLKRKLLTTFNSKHHEAKREIARLEAINADKQQAIANQVVALADPQNSFVAEEIRNVIEKHKMEIADNQEKIEILGEQHESDLAEFLDFAFSFLNDKGRRYFELSVAQRNWCTQMLFTGKIYVTENRKVYTQNISPIFSGGGNKKDLSETEKSFLVDFYNQVQTYFQQYA
ncbi:recombinase family protein [Candidatus Saccharibacteria bacterium]|nr:recombinase family protein [Candidatus Saccharibacteria bacterium]MCA9313119.1 recombinase family protein [Candidatus Saccharibacteria bacterium]